MSQRGSFVTEYMYCSQCFIAAKRVLLRADKVLCTVAVPHWNPVREGPEMPIIAGKIGSDSGLAEYIESVIAPQLARVICHAVRIAVLEDLTDDGDHEARTITVLPSNGYGGNRVN